MANTKISALAAAAPLRGGELLPAVQGGANVAITPTQLATFADSGGHRPARLRFTGDSKSGEPREALSWVMAATPLQVEPGDLSLIVGGSGTGANETGEGAPAGLTSSSRLTTMQVQIAGDVAAGCSSDIVVTIGTNNPGQGIDAEQTIADVRKFYAAFKDAGGRAMILAAIDPRAWSNPSGQQFADSVNRGYAQLAEDDPTILFVDTQPWLIDPASADAAPRGYPGQAAGAVMDALGVHDRGYGDFMKAAAFGPIYRRLYRPLLIPYPSRGAGYDSALYPRASLLGDNGRTVTLGGNDTSTKADSAAVSGTPPLGWDMSGDLSGTMHVAFSAVNSEPLAALYGGTWPVVRMTFSGTPASSGTLYLRVRYAPGYAAGTVVSEPGRYRVTAQLWFDPTGANPVCGFTGFYIGDTRVASVGHSVGSLATPTGADVIVKARSGPFTLSYVGTAIYQGYGPTSGPAIAINYFAGQPVSGTIDLIGASFVPQSDLPSPTP